MIQFRRDGTQSARGQSAHPLGLAQRRWAAPRWLSAGVVLLALALVCVQQAAVAADPASLGSGIRLSGFGTLGGSYSSRDDLSPLREWGQPDTFDDAWSWKLDSLIGVQVNARLTTQLDAAAQIVVKERAMRTLPQSLELAFIGWHPTSDTDIRAGRLGIDFYLLSDYRNVSYAYLWERPPIEFYGPALPLHFDGVDISHRIALGGGDLRLKLFGGWTETAIALGGDLGTDKIAVRPLWGGRLSFERGRWRFSAGIGQLTMDGDFAALTTSGLLPALTNPLIQPLWPKASTYAENLLTDDKTTTFSAVGIAYEDSNWQISGEIGYLGSEYKILRNTLSGYLSVGRQFGRLTPYIVLAAATPKSDVAEIERPSDLAFAYAPELKVLYEEIDGLYTRLGTDQTTLSLGVRWDLREKLALKAQWDHVTTRAYDMWGVDERTGPASEHVVDLFSLSLNWVF